MRASDAKRRARGDREGNYAHCRQPSTRSERKSWELPGPRQPRHLQGSFGRAQGDPGRSAGRVNGPEPMRFDIITIFPELVTGVLGHGILRRAQQAGLVEIRVVNLRDFAPDRHRSVDDRPYGGGEGMVLMPGPLFAAIEFCWGEAQSPGSRVVLLTPQGKTWTQEMAAEFAGLSHVVLVCGRYGGVDQRVIDTVVDLELSIGDFVLTGGEIPALVILDTVVRLIP